MNKKQNIIAIIPARGGSKGIPRKNICLLGGKPLIAFSIAAALGSKYINRVIVSTEDAEIASIAEDYGAEIIMRPQDLAQDNTPSLPVFQHVVNYLEEIEKYSPDIIVILQPTSPLRTIDDIDNCINKFLNSNCDSVVSVCEIEHPIQWMYTLNEDNVVPVDKDGILLRRRQDAPRVYRLNGAVYVTHRDILINENKIIGSNTKACIMPSERSIDIDVMLDFDIAELILSKLRD